MTLLDKKLIQAKAADIVIVWGSSVISDSIEWWTKGPSHAMVISEWPNVISADADGLMLREIRDEELRKCAILTWDALPLLSDDERKKIVNSLWPLIGTKYPDLALTSFVIGGDQSEPGKMFCSQSVSWSYLQVGRELVRRIAPQFISPLLVWTSPVLKIIYE